MILPDVNVLLYALRADLPNHGRYRDWLHGVVNSESVYGMSPQVLSSVIHIATHPRVFVNPTALDVVLQFAQALMEPQHCEIIVPGSRHWSIFTRLCQRCEARGNLIQDAWFAALAIESGAEWITTDRDYARFGGLRWRAPL
jgi:hypothetical protein